MAASAKSPVRPLDAAMERLLTQAARAATPARMAREVAMIIGEWRRTEESDVVGERIAALRELIDAGVIDAEEQVSDVDQDQPAAVAQAHATLAALQACSSAAASA